ncbi:MAG: molybdopterin oxidoreductase family protein [Gemmatimonadaceae bacterium]
MQCGIELIPDESHRAGTSQRLTVRGDASFPTNRGSLCIKGWTAAATLDHPDRLRTPLARDESGRLVPVSWDAALDRVAIGLRGAQARYGNDAAGIFGGGSLTNEKAYLLGKFARVALETSNIDYNGRFCMSSAAAAGIRAFGIDRGLPFPLADIESADAVLLAGSNIAETMPPLMQYFEAQRSRGGALVVADPRRTVTARSAAVHLALAPGSDAALANGLLHVLLRDGLVDHDFIRERTEGFERVRGVAARYWPERVERLTGIREGEIVRAARILGSATRAMVLTGRGGEQQAQGVTNVLAYINVALALGKHGRPFSGYGCLTGQGNGQGGREHGQKADQLPGYSRIDDPAARQRIAAVWDVDESDLPGVGLSAYEMLDTLGQSGGVRALWIVGSNVIVSAPNAGHVTGRLKSLDLLVVSDFFLSETAQLADVVLPAAQWAEEEGTMTNLEGRVILRRRRVMPPTGVRTDLEVIGGLAERLGCGRAFTFATARDVFSELRLATAGAPADYTGITYERITAEQGVFWPCPSEEHPGTPRLFVDRFATASGRALFHPVHHQPPAETPDREYPLYLTTGRVLAQYQSGTQTRRVAELERLAPSPLAEVHPFAARHAGISDGDAIRLVTRRGEATFTARVTQTIREDTVFVPFHWGGGQSANRLTNPTLDPTSRMPEFNVCAVRLERCADIPQGDA